MKFLYRGKDGGEKSTVWGFWFVEIKPIFSVALLCFEHGSREAYHSHAFHSLSWLLRGDLAEIVRMPNNGPLKIFRYRPRLLPIFTPRDRMHKVVSIGRSWVLTFRGPWRNTWREYLPAENRYVTLTHGRKEMP